ncbi:MAG: hypothetical protein KAI50_03035, partial [Desulfobacterales bacterium]|nr:hypothetical protein [Desulfobacterales bacterium]
PPYAHPLRALSFFFSLCSLRHALIQQRAKVFVCKKKKLGTLGTNVAFEIARLEGSSCLKKQKLIN